MRLIHVLGRSSQLKWQPIPVFFLGKFQGQRSLVSYEVHEVTKSQTWLSERARARARAHTHTHTHTHYMWWILSDMVILELCTEEILLYTCLVKKKLKAIKINWCIALLRDMHSYKQTKNPQTKVEP